MKRMEAILKRTMGLDTVAVGATIIRNAVNARMRSTGCKSLESYYLLALTSLEELNALVEEAVVPETWFFRDRKPFEALVRQVRAKWLPRNPSRPARLLSLPCSTGEEPYSMVMALLDAGVPADRFTVDAADISGGALETAARGIYRKNSFRGRDLTYRHRHFKSTPEGFLLNEEIRRKVNFFRGNLLDDKFLPGVGLYDFIFCRNLLIYFDQPTKQKAIRRVHRMLKSEGLCFFSAVEVPLVSGRGFAQEKLPLSFACRKQPSSFPGLPPASNGSKIPGAKPLNGSGASRESTGLAPTTERVDSQARPAMSADLAEARQLADAGKLAEAAGICEAHLQQNRLSAEAYFLLGLVRDAVGEPTAAGECYRKSLYLEPNHYEAILQLAALLRKQGDSSRARVLQDRAERVRPTFREF